ncbi:Putative mitochondrial 37S ribosomal protein [Komagataella phaffii]
MRVSLTSLARVPSIKFVGGPHVFKASTKSTIGQPHPLAPNNLVPSAVSQVAKDLKFEYRGDLSKRFQYRPIRDNEIELVNGGGSTVVF